LLLDASPYWFIPAYGQAAQAVGPAIQMASSPDSPVLIRIASSMFETKIFPSPIRPV
jgi:hypothetical protein